MGKQLEYGDRVDCKNASTVSADLLAGPGWEPSKEAGRDTPAEAVTIVFFECGKCSLSANEIDALHEWVRVWNMQKCRRKLLLGGADATSRANRLRRLGVLMAVLENLGVARERIQADEAWLTPSRMGEIDDIPADTVWLRMGKLEVPQQTRRREFNQSHPA